MNNDHFYKLLHQYQSGELGRRRFLGMLAASAAALGLAGRPISAMAAKAAQVRFDGWGGSVSDALREHAFKPYTEKTGVKVVDGTFAGVDEFFTKVRTSAPGTYNVFHSSGVFDYVRYVDADLDVKLDESKIPNLKNVLPRLIEPLRELSGGALSAVPYDYGTTGIAYNKDVISEDEIKEKGARILIDEKYKGTLGGINDWRTQCWYGAVMSDQDPNNVKDLDAMWEVLRKHRSLLRKYWTSGAELMSLMSSGEIVATQAWSGRIATLQKEGHPIGYYEPKDTFAWQEAMFVLRGSPMEEVQQLLNFMLDPAVAIAVSEAQGYPPSLDPSAVDLPESVTSLPAYDATGKLEGRTFANARYWNDVQPAWSKMFGRIERGF
ncbi:extracellular solute-binding protein [Allopusillimonas ginsengisoli]|nr:extracellular solute-binding protein [Allopusillimonas ginsengisoli]